MVSHFDTCLDYEVQMASFNNLCTVTALLFLSACKVDTEIELYTTDILEASENSNLTTPSLIKIEVSDCEDNKSEIMNIAGKYFDVSSVATCASSDGEEFVEFSAKTPIVYQSDYLPKNIVVGILISDTAEEIRQVSAMLDLSRFAAMESDVKRMDSTASLELNEIRVNLNNDAREAVSISVPAAFINNTPQINAEISLERRDSARLLISDVGVALTASVGKSLLFEIQ